MYILILLLLFNKISLLLYEYVNRHILETYYNLPIESMYIVSFHPKPGSYALVEVPPLDEEVALVLEDYAASK